MLRKLRSYVRVNSGENETKRDTTEEGNIHHFQNAEKKARHVVRSRWSRRKVPRSGTFRGMAVYQAQAKGQGIRLVRVLRLWCVGWMRWANGHSSPCWNRKTFRGCTTEKKLQSSCRTISSMFVKKTLILHYISVLKYLLMDEHAVVVCPGFFLKCRVFWIFSWDLSFFGVLGGKQLWEPVISRWLSVCWGWCLSQFVHISPTCKWLSKSNSLI